MTDRWKLITIEYILQYIKIQYLQHSTLRSVPPYSRGVDVDILGINEDGQGSLLHLLLPLLLIHQLPSLQPSFLSQNHNNYIHGCTNFWRISCTLHSVQPDTAFYRCTLWWNSGITLCQNFHSTKIPWAGAPTPVSLMLSLSEVWWIFWKYV